VQTNNNSFGKVVNSINNYWRYFSFE